MKRYELRQLPSEDTRMKLASFSPLLQELLSFRGIETHEEATAFLSPVYDTGIHDPYLLKDMEKGVERIITAIKNNERIGIFADYDADGIPGAVVLSDFFKKIQYQHVTVYIPHRNDEGYGLNTSAIDTLHNEGVTLLITIDCGISDHDQVAYAHNHGMDVIVTDHHLPHETLPSSYATINPKQNGCMYPEKMLCGAAVVWKVVCALLMHAYVKDTYTITAGWEKWLLDMVGLATLSDMVPLVGENRVLASYGLLVFRKSPRPGIGQLCKMMRIDQSQITEDDIGFSFTPRINAASRMGKPMDAFNLLSSTDVSEAGAYASHLDSINNERKGVVASMVKEIKKIIREREDVLRDVIVLGNPDWKPSLLGLVANSFSDEHNRPVFLWGREGAQVYKGSCRSGNGISVMDLMTEAQHALLDFGGHKEAGGFSVSLDNIHTLEDALNDAYSRLATDTVQEHIHIDKDIDLDEVSAYLFNDISRLSPFGVGNERPLFRARQAKISSVKLFGKEKNHLEIVFHRKKYRPIQAIAFFKKPESFNVSLDSDASVDIIFHIEKTMFRNFSEIRLRIVDIVPSL